MKRGLKYRLVLLFTAFTFVANPAVSFASHASVQDGKSYYQKYNTAPHSALKLVETQVPGSAGHPVHKLSNTPFISTQSQFDYAELRSLVLKNAYSVLLVRDYLFFIYPSHHFW